jgi:hypothetical protein
LRHFPRDQHLKLTTPFTMLTLKPPIRVLGDFQFYSYNT